MENAEILILGGIKKALEKMGWKPEEVAKVITGAKWKADLKVDRTELCELINSLEEVYEIIVPSEKFEKMVTVIDTIKCIEQHIEKKEVSRSGQKAAPTRER